METFPGNSNYSRESKISKVEAEPKKVEKIVEGKVIQQKKSLGKKFSEMFIGGDAKSAGAYVVYEVLLPAAKDALADAMSQGIERFLYGEVRSINRRKGGRGGNGYVSYNKISQRPPWSDDRPPMGRRARAQHDFDDIVIERRDEATAVLQRIFEYIDRYGSASVRDLYELVGVPSQYTDDKWGWTFIDEMDVMRVRGGYKLILPRPEPLDK